MTAMKEKKGKGLANEEVTQEEEVHSYPYPTSIKKRKALSKIIDMGSLPSHRGHKKARHRSSKSGLIKACSVVPLAPAKQPSIVQILDLDSSNPPKATSSKPPSGSPMTLLRNEGLTWGGFSKLCIRRTLPSIMTCL